MGHAIQGFVTRHPEQLLRRLGPLGKSLELDQAFVLVPCGHRALDYLDGLVTVNDEDAPRYDGFIYLTPSIAAFAADCSRAAPLAYVETSYAGGFGMQFAVTWASGRVLAGPFSEVDSINRCLRALGATSADKRDEFEAINLGRYRSMDDLVPEEYQ